MAKDPAMLWYWNDWQGGTVTMSRHLKGCYIDLLHAEFNNGPLSLEEIKTVLGSDFDSWGTLIKKFQQTPEGLFFNERLESEKARRENFTASRRKNREGKTIIETSEKHMSSHMSSHMETENENINRNNKKESKIQKNETPLVFPFESEKFMAVWNVLRNEKKWRNKSPAALQASLKQLSAFDEDFAIELMEKAISGNYQGVVFANTKSDYQKIKGNGKRTDKDGNTILAGRITESGAASLLAAAELYERGKNNADGDAGAKVH